MFQTLFLSSLARGHADLGQIDEAWRRIAEAISAVEATRKEFLRPRSIALQGNRTDVARAGYRKSGSAF